MRGRCRGCVRGHVSLLRFLSRTIAADPWRHFRRSRWFPLSRSDIDWGSGNEQPARAWRFTVRLCLPFLRPQNAVPPEETHKDARCTERGTTMKTRTRHAGKISRRTFLSAARHGERAEGRDFICKKRIAVVSTFWRLATPFSLYFARHQLARGVIFSFVFTLFIYFCLIFFLPFTFRSPFSGCGLTHWLLWVSFWPSFMGAFLRCSRDEATFVPVCMATVKCKRGGKRGREVMLMNVDEFR